MADVFGLEVGDLDEGAVATGVVVIVSAMEPDGDAFYVRSAGMSDEAVVGLLEVERTRRVQSLLEDMEDHDGDDY